MFQKVAVDTLFTRVLSCHTEDTEIEIDVGPMEIFLGEMHIVLYQELWIESRCKPSFQHKGTLLTLVSFDDFSIKIISTTIHVGCTFCVFC